MSTSGNPTALPNFAQLFTADPTYKNYMGLNQQFSELTNAFGRGNSPFSLQDIQGAAAAFSQAIQPYAQQFFEQDSQEVLARRAAAQQQQQQQQQQQLRLQMQNALGPGAVIQGNVTAPVNPFQQQAAPIPLNQSPLSSASSPYTNTRSTFSQPSPYGSSYGSSYGSGYGSMGGGFGGNQNVIPLEGRFGLVRLAGGGEVSEARRMLQNLQNPVQRFADGNEVKKTSVDQAAQDFIKATGAVNPAQAQSRAELDALIAANAPARERALADPLSAYNSEFQAQFLPRALEAGLTAQQALEKFAQDKTAAFGTSVRYPSNNTVMPQLQGFINAVNSGNAGDATKFASRAGMLGVGYNDFLDMAEAASPGIGSTMYKKFYDPNSEFSKQGKTFWPDLANLFQGGSPNPWSVIREIKPKTGLTDEQIGYALGITGDDVKDAFQGKLVTLPPFGTAQAGGTQVGGTQTGGTQTGGTQVGGTQVGGTQTGGTQTGGTQTGGTQTGSTTSAVTILGSTTALPELTSKFTQEVAPPPEAPPSALTPGQKGLNPSTAIVGATPVENRVAEVTETAINKIPESERVTTPQLDTQFRASAPRTPTYDRFGRITGYNYSPAAKLTPATGTNVFNFVPPGITSRPRSLLNIGDVPGVMVDPVTGQMRLPLSASQQFARDRSELDTAIRELYRRKSATDSSVPSTIPAPAAEAFRQLAMTDPSLSKQIRYRDISQDVYDPTKADASLRAQFGRPQAEAALTKAFDPFFERNRAALTSLAQAATAPKTYSEMYPDIAAAYDKLSAAEKAKFPTLQDYERYHFDTYGKNEGRVSPLELMAKANPLRGPYTTPFFSKGGEASTEDFIKKQSGGDVSRETSTSKQQLDKLAQESKRKKA